MFRFSLCTAAAVMLMQAAADFTICRSCRTFLPPLCCTVTPPAQCCTAVSNDICQSHLMCLDNSSLVDGTTLKLNGTDVGTDGTDAVCTDLGVDGCTYEVDVQNLGNGIWKGGFRIVAPGDPYWGTYRINVTVSGFLLECDSITSVQGRWLSVQSSSEPQQIQYEVGVARSYEVESSALWGASATASMQAGFKAFGASASTTISGTLSTQMGQTYSSTMETSETTSHTFSFPAGVIWQWQFKVSDSCGVTVAQVDEMALTAGAFEPPCCLPEYFANISNPTGDCAPGTPNLCNLTRQTTPSLFL